jgi:hypothetical protein
MKTTEEVQQQTDREWFKEHKEAMGYLTELDAVDAVEIIEQLMDMGAINLNHPLADDIFEMAKQAVSRLFIADKANPKLRKILTDQWETHDEWRRQNVESWGDL